MIKILIADDHAIVREGLKRILADFSDFVITGEAGNEEEVLKKVKEKNYDVVLLDIWMSNGNELDILKRIKNMRPHLPILMLGMQLEDQFVIRSFRTGASGYLTKKSAPDELIRAIQRVSQGRKYISPSIAEKLACNIEVGTEKSLHEMLSDREYQVMCMIAWGKTIKKIAEELSLAISTISTYIVFLKK